MDTLLVTGAAGQIGSELTLALRKRYGGSAVVASDVRLPADVSLRDGGPFEFVDCLDPHHITRVMQIHQIDTIYHLAALLSAVMSKAGVYGLIRVLANDYAAEGIRVNGVIPGYTDTPMNDYVQRPEGHERIVATIPLRRQGTAAEVASGR